MSNPRLYNYLSLIIAAVCFGTIPIFSSFLNFYGVSSLQQGLFRAVFTTLYLFIGLGVVFAFRDIRIKQGHSSYFMIYGLIGIALGIIAYITAIALGTPVVVAVSLTYLYPAITLILSRIFLREPFTLTRLVALPLSISGAVIVSLPLTPTLKQVPIMGIVLAIFNAIFAASYMILGRKWGGHEGYRPSVITFWGFLFATMWMGPLILILSLFIMDPRVMGFQVFLPPQAWLLLLAFALFGTAVPYLLTNVGIKNIDASAAAIILLLDPICAVIFGIIFLGQPLLLWQAIGAILILIASVLIALESRFSVAKVI